MKCEREFSNGVAGLTWIICLILVLRFEFDRSSSFGSVWRFHNIVFWSGGENLCLYPNEGNKTKVGFCGLMRNYSFVSLHDCGW